MAHAGKSETASSRLHAGGLVLAHVETNAIVAYQQRQRALRIHQPYRNLLARGVLDGVGDRRLRDPQHVVLHRSRHAPRATVAVDLQCELTTAGQSLRRGLHGLQKIVALRGLRIEIPHRATRRVGA